MATIKGVWVFNDVVSHFYWLASYQMINVTFTSNGERFTSLYWYDVPAGDDTIYHLSYDETLAVAGPFGNLYNWDNDAYKTVDFGSAEQDVSDEFLAWMQENATQQASEGTTPTAEGVKENSKSLITASNAKTGKSDANLTDAVNTLLEGYGQGGGGVSVTGLRKFNDTINTDGITLQVYTSEDEVDAAMGTMQTPPTNACVCDITLLSGSTAIDCQLWCFYFQYEAESAFYVWLNINGSPTPPFASANGEVALNFLSGAIIDIKDAGQYAEWLLANTTAVGCDGMPIEVTTAEQMTALLSTAEVGAIYKYTGETTDTYENGALYEFDGNGFTKLVDDIPSYDGTITVE